MTKEEITMLGFEIVAYAGEARSKLIEALEAAKKGDYDKAETFCQSANQSILEAHKAQTSLLQEEATGSDIAFSVTLMHGQDHLMTTLLLQDMMKHLIELYKRG
ncbi:TPA: PTS lactose/cellobiose transporter subunit IIA [Streptococcus equi subsp. zooepidemicus]|uniref:lactose-specific PTS transporter subunit IIA n=1 Tax=Streptococcus equi TaxID=1336 RepID=UPI0005B73416|nr:lactose-specific PTS transporter subunit IIA [Streptococcus equi]KIQ75776.1 PTS system lactose-specific transporter subunit IIA [Streptococcus equi subsp. zooepidemicus]MCD3424457.1 lactose-specific PTS transporter subunit IIA [Streptococcus equi subsp. zooepidemicus]HEL0026528.1 PTS lactose/cellobiose transporter subunit IIA [Streptococcus equi subsp. zooepidemicus]HEL0734144.1 PTS lactose/cellobiose transporter subunit IIA [Streptococcus equi subsp. zooepidemicus]HEL1057869.1 PTS lactose/